MDWRDFMKGFFGGRPPNSSGGGEQRDVWPPPPPIPEFRRAEDETSQLPPTEKVPFWGRRNHSTPNNENHEGFEDFGNRFVFGDLFSTMGEMFKEMERSMRDMENFFGDMKIEDHTKMIPFPSPPAIQDLTRPDSSDNNVRDFVLKEPETKERENRQYNRHYIPAPNNAKEKIDRDLDDLHQKSMLDLADLPVPNTSLDSHSQDQQHGTMEPFNFSQQRGAATSSFQQTYQTFSFRNGRWEGEIIKEDQNGKEVTKYFQDKNGKRHETTEYFPKNGSPHKPAIMDLGTDMIPSMPSSHEPTRLFQFFDKFFKPRM